MPLWCVCISITVSYVMNDTGNSKQNEANKKVIYNAKCRFIQQQKLLPDRNNETSSGVYNYDTTFQELF